MEDAVDQSLCGVAVFEVEEAFAEAARPGARSRVMRSSSRAAVMTCGAAGRVRSPRRHPGGDPCGLRDRKLPYRWAKAKGSIPNGEAIVRLQTARRIWQLLSGTDDDCVARAWFIGVNPRLGDVQPRLPGEDPGTITGWLLLCLDDIGWLGIHPRHRTDASVSGTQGEPARALIFGARLSAALPGVSCDEHSRLCCLPLG